jgi:uncharacterized protein (TIGR01777 family)
MRIAITGSTGLIGSALVAALEADGHAITRVVRPASSAQGVLWDPERGTIDLNGLEGHEAVIHLAGEQIAGLWTKERKRRIRESRTRGTALLATSLTRLRRPPAVLVSASAIGFYGDRPSSEPVDETDRKGSGFLADVSDAWERATDPAREGGIRVANTRFGLVLSRRGGALAPLLCVFRLGLGGRIGSGQQTWSWVAIDDVVGAVRFVIATAALEGPVNVVAPFPVSNLAFTRALGRVLRRPTLFAVPEIVLRTVAGEMARELLLFGVRAVPRKLLDAGYEFRYPEVETALKHVLKP